jgi:hypothetical protein
MAISYCGREGGVIFKNIVVVYNKVQAHKQAINLKNAIKRSDNLGNF